MTAKLYCKLVGVILLVVAAAGLAMPTLMGMDLSKRHSAVHALTGALLAWLGFGGSPEATAKAAALGFGAVYTLLGIAGFFMTQILPGLRIYHADLLTNCIHLVVGLLGLAAGMMSPKTAAQAA